jgi:DNA polymerase II small subunit
MADDTASPPFPPGEAGIRKLMELGFRFALDAETALSAADSNAYAELLQSEKRMISLEDANTAIAAAKSKKVEVVRPNLRPPSAEYAPDIKILHQLDVTGKSRSTGKPEDFIAYFRNRYERLSKMLHHGDVAYPNTGVGEARQIGMSMGKGAPIRKARVIAMVYEKKIARTESIILDLEDLEGSCRAVIKKGAPAYEKAKLVVRDEVIAVKGRITDFGLSIDDIEWPDLPFARETRRSENDLSCAYISDIHIGSRHFMEDVFERFLDWLCLRGTETEIAGKIKYIVLAGDVIDGVGIYPKQEKDLNIKDVFKQYEVFDRWVERLPDRIEIIVSPGNHDAVRRAEPMPALGKDMISSRAICVGNPSTVLIENVRHTIYHGTSLDSMIASIHGLSYSHPEIASREFLRRRHLSPIYGQNQVVPEQIDYMVLEGEPDVLNCGHIHKNGYARYRGTHIVNSGTFQDRTDFQVEHGHVPTPGVVGVIDLKTSAYRNVNLIGDG